MWPTAAGQQHPQQSAGQAGAAQAGSAAKPSLPKVKRGRFGTAAPLQARLQGAPAALQCMEMTSMQNLCLQPARGCHHTASAYLGTAAGRRAADQRQLRGGRQLAPPPARYQRAANVRHNRAGREGTPPSMRARQQRRGLREDRHGDPPGSTGLCGQLRAHSGFPGPQQCAAPGARPAARGVTARGTARGSAGPRPSVRPSGGRRGRGGTGSPLAGRVRPPSPAAAAQPSPAPGAHGGPAPGRCRDGGASA